MKRITITFEQHYSYKNPYNPNEYERGDVKLCSPKGNCCLGICLSQMGYGVRAVMKTGLAKPSSFFELALASKGGAARKLLTVDGGYTVVDSLLTREAINVNDGIFDGVNEWGEISYEDRMGYLITLFGENEVYPIDLHFKHGEPYNPEKWENLLKQDD